MEIISIPNQIIKAPLERLNLKIVDSIAFHHMANKVWTVKDVERYHTAHNGWDAIGYNYFITFDGIIYRGRGLHKGAGVANNNSHIISVGLQGDFTVQYPTQLQYIRCCELADCLKKAIPRIEKISKHSDWNNTACPGKNFDIRIIENMLETYESKKGQYFINNKTYEIEYIRNGGESQMSKFIDIENHYAKNHIQKLEDYGIINGYEDGTFKPDEPITRGQVAIMVANALTILGK